MKKLLIPLFAAGCLSVAAAPETSLPQIKLKGYLGDRLDRMIAGHVEGRDVDYITAPFLEKTETTFRWQTEFWGKYMHSAVPYLAYHPTEEFRRKIDRGVERILASQEAGGYIGNYPDELRCGEGWDVWGMKYTLLGLLHYYDLTQDEKTLAAAKRLCDYVIGEIGPNGRRGRALWTTGNWSGYASSSILEPVVWLYRRTREQKYLDFAGYIVEGMTQKDRGPALIEFALKGISVADRNDPGFAKSGEWTYVCKSGRDKAYEMMSCYQGMLDYAQTLEQEGRGGRLTEDIRRAALMTAEDIVREEINLAGGCASSEAWFHGAKKQHLQYVHLQETCVTTTWMRLCEKLLEMTDDPKWADQLERTFYNAYLGALRPDGGEFEAYTPLNGNRWHGMHHCYMHTDCCTANGPRGFLCFLRELFKDDAKGFTFNFYTTALVKGFDMYSLYPRNGNVRIVSHVEGRGKVPMRLRIPAFSERTEVRLNGRRLEGAVAGGYFSFEHEWKLGDIVEISFSMPFVAHTLDHAVAFTYGPVLLARDSRFGEGSLSAPWTFVKPIRDGQTMTNFTPTRVPSDEFWMTFTTVLPDSIHSENPEGGIGEAVTFCDFASAGDRWESKNYYRTWFPVERGPRGND